jgi:excisionase family DNA binding protein
VEFVLSDPESVDRLTLSVAEVAKSLGTSTSFVNTQIKKGSLPSFKLGRRRFVSVAELRAFITKQKAA